MKKKYLYCLVPVLFLMLFPGALSGAQGGFPAPNGAVNDFAGVVESSYARKMEDLAREVWDKTGTAIVVAVMPDIGDNVPDEYANRLYQAWGVGEKGKDRGVLIFLAVKERKIRIETGYGVEGILPDGLVGEILDRYVLPYLKAGQYGKGLTNGVLAVASVIAKDAHVELSGAPATVRLRERPAQSAGRSLLSVILMIIAAALLLGTRQGRALLPFLLIMLMGSGRGGGHRGGGGFGGGFEGFGGGLSGGGGASRDF